jgi:hypothetical protein
MRKLSLKRISTGRPPHVYASIESYPGKVFSPSQCGQVSLQTPSEIDICRRVDSPSARRYTPDHHPAFVAGEIGQTIPLDSHDESAALGVAIVGVWNEDWILAHDSGESQPRHGLN